MVTRWGVHIISSLVTTLMVWKLLLTLFRTNKFPWRSLFWLGGLFVTGYRLRTIWCHVTSFLMTLNFVWLVAVEWKQCFTCSFHAPFSPLCGACLGLRLVYHQLIWIPYRIIFFSLFILLEDRKLVVHSCSLSGYVVFGLCGMSGITEFSRLRKTQFTRCSIKSSYIHFGGWMLIMSILV